MKSKTADTAGPIELLASEYGIDGTVSRLPGENENYLVKSSDGARYVLKLVSEHEPIAPLELEFAAVEAVRASGLNLALPLIVLTDREMADTTYRAPDGSVLRGRLTTFVPGIPWCEAGAATPERFTAAGELLARLATAFGTVDSATAHRTHRWDLSSAETRRAKVSLIDDPKRRRIAERAFVLYTACTAPRLATLPHSLIHGDLNDENILLTEGRVSGLLDFGDCLHNPTVCDLAIALTYLSLDQPDPLAACAQIVAGYHAVRPLEAAEIEVLFPLICGRLALSVVTAAERHRMDPGRDTWFATEERAWNALEGYVSLDPVGAAERLASGTEVSVYPDRAADYDGVLERRRRYFSNALSLTYDPPLKISRGFRQFLFDERERPYLDLYNNVCHVGHSHPTVVEAGARQMRQLNTNTRYLYDGLVEYAERLCATLPPQLECCFFLNSGSEANELALRLASTHTSATDVIVLDNAYHGHTSTLVDISPYKFMGKGGAGSAKPWVHVAPMPDGYRGKHRGHDRAVGKAYGNEVGRIISSLDRPVAAFIAESLPSCGGQIVPPDEYFETVFHHVRAAGGVCILDEVQIGFGRVGTHFWGFEPQNVVPDIVVMGKPIGNGHPMAAVVTTKEIAQSFADAGMEFFSTFGGNPVSCAIGLAVLKVIRDENLQENARVVGVRLLEGLRKLMARHSVIGDVRGVGLFIGIELVHSRETLEPATEATAWLVNELRERGILTGTDGPFQNVVKIKPPMVVTADDADMAVRQVDDVLTAAHRLS